MGTYPSVPSRIRPTGKLLSEHLKDNPELVGQSVCDRYGPDIPFLPKVKDKKNLIKMTVTLTMTRYSLLLKPFRFSYIPTKALPSVCMRRTLKNSAMSIISPR